MGILSNQLTNSKLGLKGNKPAQRAGSLPSSTIHSKESLAKSTLDLDGNTPDKYTDSLPE
jgi:hypothetical protein